MSLQGKTVLIPGASRPIGRAIARRFADKGAALILPYHDWPESNQEMIEEFGSKNSNFLAMPVDLRHKDQVIALTDAIKEKFGSLDFLVNNIERGGMPVVHGGYDQAHNAGQWDVEIATTLTAKWLLYHYCIPLMRGGHGRAVVNLSSVAALSGRSGPMAAFFNDGYSAANRAISSFTETWAREAAPDIRVNELMIGLIQGRHGEGTRGWGLLTEKEKNDLRQHTLLRRTGLPDEVAAAVFFLAVEATFITGTVMRMDGGIVLGADRVPEIPTGIL